MSFRLAIIILNYNSAEDSICLYKLIEQFGLKSTTVCVIDNNSSKADRDILQKNIPSANLRLLSKNKGYAAGNNVGIQEAIALNIPYILLLNPDIRLDANCINILLHTIKAAKNTAVVGPRICFRENPNLVYSDGGMVDKQKGFYTYHRNDKKELSSGEKDFTIQKVDYVNGSVFMAKTAVFQEIGYMREGFFLYFEETEWCLRAASKGYSSVVNTEAVAYHESSKKGERYHYFMTRNRLWLAKTEPQYYKATLAAVWQPLKKQLIKCIKQRTWPNIILRAKCRGLIAGVFGRIK